MTLLVLVKWWWWWYTMLEVLMTKVLLLLIPDSGKWRMPCIDPGDPVTDRYSETVLVTTPTRLFWRRYYSGDCPICVDGDCVTFPIWTLLWLPTTWRYHGRKFTIPVFDSVHSCYDLRDFGWPCSIHTFTYVDTVIYGGIRCSDFVVITTFYVDSLGWFTLFTICDCYDFRYVVRYRWFSFTLVISPGLPLIYRCLLLVLHLRFGYDCGLTGDVDLLWRLFFDDIRPLTVMVLLLIVLSDPIYILMMMIVEGIYSVGNYWCCC